MNIYVVLPTYNERANIGIIVHRLFAQCSELHVLVVDDNSPDGTSQVVSGLRETYPRLELLCRKDERGFGPAYLAAFRHVLSNRSADAILMMDADLSHDPKYIPAMLDRIANYDAVIGSRYTRGGAVAGWELWRRVLSRAGNAYIRAITQMPFHDCTSGFILIRTDLLRRLDLSGIGSSGYAFLMELKFTMWRSNARISEVPITFHNRAEGESKLSGHIVSEGVRAPWNVRYRRRPEQFRQHGAGTTNP